MFTPRFLPFITRVAYVIKYCSVFNGTHPLESLWPGKLTSSRSLPQMLFGTEISEISVVLGFHFYQVVSDKAMVT